MSLVVCHMVRFVTIPMFMKVSFELPNTTKFAKATDSALRVYH